MYATNTDYHPTPVALKETQRLRWGEPGECGPAPRLFRRFGYYTPDDYYEALVTGLVSQSKTWLDVGCGRDIFPHNRALARQLVERCELVVGIDPDDTIQENTFVHERAQCTIEQFHADRTFDLVTLRMVAEHIQDPMEVLRSLVRLTSTGSKVVVYTVNRWSPAAIAACLIPFRFHHALKKRLWDTEEKDTFPVAYRMNTRKQLAGIFAAAGFREGHFAHVDDCRSFFQYRALQLCELTLWRLCQALGVTYPESCLLGVYERVSP